MPTPLALCQTEMPLRGSGHSPSVADQAPCFQSLESLDVWADQPPHKLAGVLAYHPRSSSTSTSSQRGKLLVCHDYKGGYTEKPAGAAYTFNFWSYCDTFIYFSHHRIAVPPSGWINAAHRQGVKMLGTLIFEHAESQSDCLRLLVGRLPQTPSGPAHPSSTYSLPVSSHYARVLANLAYQRGFDGYLLNIEVPLRGGFEQTRALCLWISLLERELKSLIGEHAHVIWYDSVIVDGRLAWQDRLNSLNLPFFMPSTSFFTNYTWKPFYPTQIAQYFLSLNEELLQNKQKRLSDVFVGVDVWGRGQHGGGGLSSYKAITHIDPEFLGLSVALFGNAWTWESEQDKPGWSWDVWWQYERTLWIGPADPEDTPDVENPTPPGASESGCDHGPFKPIAAFFGRESPPNPIILPFYTTFSPGVGHGWFIQGIKVWKAPLPGWTDVDKNCSLGDLLWPRPALTWHDSQSAEPVPVALPELNMAEAWAGGSSLRLSVSLPGSAADDAFFRCLWIPIQSLSITLSIPYVMTLVFKHAFNPESSAEVDVGLFAKAFASDSEEQELEISPLDSECADLANGWRKLAIQLSIPVGSAADATVAVGVLAGFAMEDPTQPVGLNLTFGSLAVYPLAPALLLEPTPKIIWAAFQPAGTTASPFTGVLTWEVGAYLPRLTAINLVSPEDPKPAWLTNASSLRFLHFDIYVLPHPTAQTPALQPEDAIWIGTTGLDGRANRFFVDPAGLPDLPEGTKAVRLYVQGVTERGDVLPWEDCVWTDVQR